MLFLESIHKYRTRIASHTSTLVDHIVTNCEEKVTQIGVIQSGVIDTFLSDHQLTFCTRKIKRVKTNNHKQFSFRSLKNYSMGNFERELKILRSQTTKRLVTLNPSTVT